MSCRKITTLSTILVLALMSGCASPAPEGRGSAAPRGATGPEPRALTAFVEDTVDLSSSSKVSIRTSLVSDPSVLTVTTPGQPGEATLELAEERCTLRLVQASASAVGLEFGDDDIENSIMVTVAFHGVETPVARPSLTWSIDYGEGQLGAHVSLFADHDGGETLTVSRGVGSIAELFYAELSCAPGIDAVEVYTRSVAPRVTISAEG